MKLPGIFALALGSAFFAILSIFASQSVAAQTAENSLKQSCHSATRAFELRETGTDKLAVADPAAPGELRQAALLFYQCAQSESDPYMHQLFLAYYANTLYRVSQYKNDSRAKQLAETAASRLQSSQFTDVRELVAKISIPSHIDQSRPAANHPAPVHSAAYCHDLKPNIVTTLAAVSNAIDSASNAGTNDTQVLAGSTARYGSAFKYVEDDYNAVQTDLENANAALGVASEVTSNLNEQEKPAVTQALSLIGTTISYVDTYSRLALGFERGINSSNRRLAYARVSAALAAGMHNSSYTYSNGNASCYSFSSNSANYYGTSQSTTTYNNSATIAQQNAANALTAAQAGRLSYAQADEVLTEKLPILNQINNAVTAATSSWNKACLPG